MRRLTVIGLMIALLIVPALVEPPGAEAMNNESAALLAGAIALFGRPVLNAIAQDIFYEPCPTRVVHRPAKVIYKRVYVYRDDVLRDCRRIQSPYEKGFCDELRRIEREYERGRRDARYYYYEYIDP